MTAHLPFVLQLLEYQGNNGGRGQFCQCQNRLATRTRLKGDWYKEIPICHPVLAFFIVRRCYFKEHRGEDVTDIRRIDRQTHPGDDENEVQCLCLRARWVPSRNNSSSTMSKRLDGCHVQIFIADPLYEI
ncbi:hypothetical protein ARMGADRAFT_122339 [Armillaria gallica]|uniref:Uncharacterized protein n=1 Tax=Armillaria gallica TaxID=47427 RepID=A0A2H3DYI4_ARMGA|nr:hypothetical protein ARMGADRAFT_122339 [Armillaria gallica]